MVLGVLVGARSVVGAGTRSADPKCGCAVKPAALDRSRPAVPSPPAAATRRSYRYRASEIRQHEAGASLRRRSCGRRARVGCRPGQGVEADLGGRAMWIRWIIGRFPARDTGGGRPRRSRIRWRWCRSWTRSGCSREAGDVTDVGHGSRGHDWSDTGWPHQRGAACQGGGLESHTLELVDSRENHIPSSIWTESGRTPVLPTIVKWSRAGRARPIRRPTKALSAFEDASAHDGDNPIRLLDDPTAY